MPRPSDTITIPAEDLGRLLAVLQSHLHRDTSVRDLLSGLEPHWLCDQSSSFVREIPVSPEEQLATILKWIESGGN